MLLFKKNKKSCGEKVIDPTKCFNPTYINPDIPANRINAQRIKGTIAKSVAVVPEKFPAVITASEINIPTTPTTTATTTAVIVFIYSHPLLKVV